MLRTSAFLLLVVAFPGFADSLGDFNHDFWAWRAIEQPFTGDDIPRIERPAAMRIDWSASAVAGRRAELAKWEQRLTALKPSAQKPVRERVDYRLLASAVARVRWELEVQQNWKRNPVFYVEQTIGAVYALLVPPPPFGDERRAQLVTRMDSIPATLTAARVNLTDMRQPFTRLAVDALDGLPKRFEAMNKGLEPLLDEATRKALRESTRRAGAALESYRTWLQQKLPGLRQDTATGRENYLYFLKNVALLPYTPEQMLAMSQMELSRTIAFETYQQTRDEGMAQVPLFANQAAQMDRERAEEERVRGFLVKHEILSVPAWMKHYRNLPLPSYVLPFAEFGVTDDLTSATRLDQDGTSYINVPDEKLGFFALSTAHDPRPILVHEGVPGHYFQMCLSWANPDPIRRHYYDSSANEGIGFYAEEMMLQAGFFDDSPRTREVIYRFMRLRALRVEVDVKLALGSFTLRQAADYLARTVPMDQGTALEEASSFAATPGQAITYQIGKSQIIKLLSDARLKQGTEFRLQKFHDFVWSNGNVPLSLQRWELLGDASDVP